MSDESTHKIPYMFSYDSYKPTGEETQFIGNLVNIKPNDISYIFFSNNNIDDINTILIEEIKEMTFERYNKKMVIQPQDRNHLLTIMRHVYLKNVQNHYPTDIEVMLLNKEVFKILIPGVMSELIARIRYLNDINRYSSPYDSPSFSILPLPTNTCKTNGNFRQPTDLFGF